MHILSYLLFPFALIYDGVTRLRNSLYDRQFFKTYVIPKKSICVGNLTLGGTGKSPLVNYLIDVLKDEYAIQVLSRGYGRETKGFVQANSSTSPNEIGDEPQMYYNRYADSIQVAVCESRKEGIEKIMEAKAPDLFLLDDAFQHRKVKAGLQIVLSDYKRPFFMDYLVPMGRLREARKGIKRADVLIYSKCPEQIPATTKELYLAKSQLNPSQVFFSWISYGKLIPISEVNHGEVKKVLLVTGIANPAPLLAELKRKYEVETLYYSDHHNYSVADIHKIYKKFDTFARGNSIIVTTEKDYVKLKAPAFASLLTEKPWYYQPMQVELDRPAVFKEIIKSYVRKI